MYYLREHLRIGSTVNRFGERTYFAEIEVFTKEVNTKGEVFQMLHIERMAMMKDEKAVRKAALVRYRQFYHCKKNGRDAKRCKSTYNGKQVIYYLPKK